MSENAGWYAGVVALLAAGLIGAWAASACRRAQRRGLPGSDTLVWASLAAVFLIYAQIRLVRSWGWLAGLGQWLRMVAKQNGWYADRRTFQIVATVAVALVVVVLLLYGLLWMWHYIKRYRLAIGFASLAVGFAAIRFISLHEVDAWTSAMPWVRPLVEFISSAGVSAVAIARLSHLGEISWLRRVG